MSTTSSWQPHHHKVAGKCKRSGTCEFRLENTRARNPVFFSDKVAAVVTEGGSLFPPFRGSQREHTSLYPSIAPTARAGRKPGALHRRPDWQWHQTPVKYLWLTRSTTPELSVPFPAIPHPTESRCASKQWPRISLRIAMPPQLPTRVQGLHIGPGPATYCAPCETAEKPVPEAAYCTWLSSPRIPVTDKLAIPAPKEDRVVPNQRPHRYRSRPTPPHRTAATRVAWDPFQLTVTPHTHQKKKGSTDVAPLQDEKANRRNIPNSLVRRRLRVGPIHTRQEIHDHEQPQAKHPPRRRQQAEAGVTRAGRCPTPRGRGEPKPHGASRSPNTEKSHNRTRQTHGASQSLNTEKSHSRTRQTHRASRSPNTEKSHSRTRQTHGASQSLNTEKSHSRTRQNTRGEPKPQPTENTRGEPKPQPRRGQQKTQNTNHTEVQKPSNQKGRRRKENRRNTKERKRRKNKEGKGKQRKAQEQRRERRREDAQTGRPREEAKMKAWLHGPITEIVRVNQKIPSTATCKQDQARAPVAAGTATSATQLEKAGTVTLAPTSGKERKEVLIGSQPL